MGVALLGDFEAASPTLDALGSLEHLLAWKASQSGIDPLGTTDHPATQLALDNISGHRDGNDSPTTCTITNCPGDQFYSLLPEIRTAVADAVAIPEPGSSALVATAVGVLAVLCRRRNQRSAVDCAPINAFVWMPLKQDTQLRQRRARPCRAPARRR
jgi:hypothetical protein